MIKNILILLIFILININLLDLILIKWNIDYYKKLKDRCIKIKKEIYEIETYRYNIINYIYDIDKQNKKKKIEDRYNLIYNINFYLIIILLIIEIIKLLKKKRTNYKLILILLIIYYYLNFFIKKNRKQILELKSKENNNFKYYKIYKILNILLIHNENYKKIKYKEQKLIDIIKKNISDIYKIDSSKIDIELIIDKSIKNYDIAKFLMLNEKEFIENLYIYINSLPSPSSPSPTSSTSSTSLTSTSSPTSPSEDPEDSIIYIKNIDSNSYVYDIIFTREIEEKFKKEDFKYNDKINYIDYFNENKYILLNENFEYEKNKIVELLNNNIYILILLLLIVIIFINISHYLFKKLNNLIYGLLLFIIIILYLIFIWLKLK